MPFEHIYADSSGKIKARSHAGLTDRQSQLLSYIEWRLSNGMITPSYEEMCEHLGLASKSGVHRLVTALTDRGFLVKPTRRARAIKLAFQPDTNLTDAFRMVLRDCSLSRGATMELSRILGVIR